jgi:predicted unusual protein kinase regulating ubiquinone biosynthesis (AarF/ABC1/UbiB family)
MAVDDGNDKTNNGKRDNEPKKIQKIKSSTFSRSMSLAKLGVSTGMQIATHGLTTLLSNKDAKQNKWNELLKTQATSIAKELGELKGSLMKAGQMLSVYGEHFLPKEANDILKSLQMDSAQVEWPQIEKVLIQELGPEKLAQLEIDRNPIGSASLGQVYKAVIKESGKIVAVKVQYPGVEKAIASDLNALRNFLNLLKLIPSGPYMDTVIEEITTMLVQETNYLNEALATKEYGELLANDSRFVVPKVFDYFSTQKIITTSFEPGVRPDDPMVLSLRPSRRNTLAENFLDLYFKELFVWGFVQTDPHLGNYKIRVNADGMDQLVLLDFGAVRKFSAPFLNPYRRMIKAAVTDDARTLTENAKQLKFVLASDSAELVTLFEEFCLLTVEPFKAHGEQGYDWKSSDLPNRLTKKAFKIIQGFPLRPPPKEIIFLDRKTAGVFVFLSVLGAKFNAGLVLEKYLKELK